VLQLVVQARRHPAHRRLVRPGAALGDL